MSTAKSLGIYFCVYIYMFNVVYVVYGIYVRLCVALRGGNYWMWMETIDDMSNALIRSPIVSPVVFESNL